MSCIKLDVLNGNDAINGWNEKILFFADTTKIWHLISDSKWHQLVIAIS